MNSDDVANANLRAGGAGILSDDPLANPSQMSIGPSSRADHHALYSTLSGTSGVDSLLAPNAGTTPLRDAQSGGHAFYSEAEEEGVPRQRGPMDEREKQAALRAQLGQRMNIPKVVDQVAMEVEKAFAVFLETFQPEGAETTEGSTNVYYVDQILQMKEENRTTLLVDLHHLRAADKMLADTVKMDFRRFSPFLNKALQKCVEKFIPEYLTAGTTALRDFWVSFLAMEEQTKIRDLHAGLIGGLTTIVGTVTRTSIVRPELLYGTFQCSVCKELYPNIAQQYAYTKPPRCMNPLCNNTDTFDLLSERSKFVDWQKIRIQENANEIPPGSTPRSMDVIVRHEMCERAKPGDICVFTGMLMAIPDVAQLLMSGRHLNLQQSLKEMGRKKDSAIGQGIMGLKSLGCRELAYRLVFICSTVQTSNDKYAHFYSDGDLNESMRTDYIASLLTQGQRDEMVEMIDSKTNYQDLISSIAPTIFGHERIKEGLLLQLLGGVHKMTPEGTNKLRGDINVCIVGDPGLSKSQFLKYITGFLPRSVYTSGKASSAAGLTASVVKDEETGDFTIEAGALMLADNGICCIDEFDKMEIKDQVAIHEAMEQQTISIAKAGIHATLNARTSILAAANPVGGRYDKSKSLRQNVNLSPPIMSRFDLFFVVLDHVEKEHDYLIARHILQVHRDRDEAIQPKYSTDQLRRFIMFAKALRPKMSDEANELLVQTYISLRRADSRGAKRSGYRVTVRQLESLIRLSEAMARAHAEPIVKAEHVKAASRLLRSSMPQTDKGEVDLDEPEQQIVAAVGMVGGEDVANADGAAEPAVDAQETVAEPPSRSVVIKASEYQRICQMIIAMMAEQDRHRRVQYELGQASKEAVAPSAAEGDAMDTEENEGASLEQEEQGGDAGVAGVPEFGMKFKEIVDWYLNLVESQIQEEEDYFAEQKLIQKVIKRMVKKDRLLYPLMTAETTLEETLADQVRLDEETVLMIHPSVDVDELGQL